MTLQNYIAKYGEKEGTRRWKNNEKSKRWRQKNPGYTKRWYQARREKHIEYYKQHREERAEYNKQYHQEHREERLEHMKQYNKCWHQTPYGRAQYLIDNYRRNDRLYNRGECTLTAQWVMDNIFTKKCLYCGESDWQLLGCDRINNSKPHTIENVVCSCGKCNHKRNTMGFLKFAYSIGAKDSESLVIQY